MRIVTLLLVLGLAVGTGAQSKLPKFSVVHVSDTYGAVVLGAEVRAVPADADRGTVVVRTDSNGNAYLNLFPGKYEFTVGARAAKPQQFSWDASWDHPLSQKVILKFDFTPTTANGEASQPDQTISPARAIPTGLAPGMQVKLVSDATDGEKVYAVIFAKGDEVLSGLTDFAIQYKVEAAHFTGIGAVSGATVGWLDLEAKSYRPIHVDQQVEVLSMMGDVATFNGKPVVHAHMVFGRQDGSTVGGHLWEAHVNPTLEVFVSVDPVGLKKKQDVESGMKLIDPKQ